MFQGTLSQDVRDVLVPLVKGWGVGDVAFPCSGNFTVARSLHREGLPFRLHGNDVTLYSCALGSLYAGLDLAVSVNPDPALDLGWLAPYLDEPRSRVAAVLAWADHARAWVKRDANPYYARIARAARAQFPALHAALMAKMEGSDLRLASFYAGDCVDFLDSLGPDVGVISAPPVYRGGYEAMWKHLEHCLTWEPPAYVKFDDARMGAFVESIRGRRAWAIVTQAARDDWAGHLLAVTRATNRSPRFFVYASEARDVRLVVPRQELTPTLFPRPEEGRELEGPLRLVPLAAGEFAALRAQYLDPRIAPAVAMLPLAVLAGPVLVGAIAFSRCTLPLAGVDLPQVYLMTDFAASGGPPRLSKLVLAAALSREAQFLLERALGRRFESVVTTAFSDHPASMKYRGLFRLLTRKEKAPGEDGPRYRLNYGAPLGGKSLDSAFSDWKAAHAGPVRAG